MSKSKRGLGEVELDLGRYELRRSGRRVRLEKKPMELLIFLVGRREQMVSREDIVKKLWRSNLFIDTERNINNIMRKMRTALGDDADRPRFIETVVGKGYRFIGPVRVIAAQFALADSSKPFSSIENIRDWRERPSLAVLPLTLVGKKVDDNGLCLGFADAVAARLGTLQGVDVLPTSSVLNLQLDAPAPDIAVRLGTRFVVHGAIQLSKGQWRLSIEMLDTATQKVCITRKNDLDANRTAEHVAEIEADVAKQIASVLKRPLQAPAIHPQPRHSTDPLAYAEFMRGYRLSVSGDAAQLNQATQHLTQAVSRDPAFALAHATLSLACTTLHFEFDPARVWLEKAEFHCRRALEIDPNLPEGHVASAFLLWGPSKNFQHLEAISELKRALALQNNLPHAYSRLGTILAHIGLLDHARTMFERGRPFHPKKMVNPSVVQVSIWSLDYGRAREEIKAWLAESPGHKYAMYFAPLPALMTGDWKEAKALLDEARRVLPEEPLMISLEGVFLALTGKKKMALECITRSCASPKSFGHSHHTYYQIACIQALVGQRETAFEWLERSVTTGFACWPFFLKDPRLQNLRGLAEFEMLVSSLQAKYPDHVGLL